MRRGFNEACDLHFAHLIAAILGGFGGQLGLYLCVSFKIGHWTGAPITRVTNILEFDGVVAFEAGVRDIVPVIVCQALRIRECLSIALE